MFRKIFIFFVMMVCSTAIWAANLFSAEVWMGNDQQAHFFAFKSIQDAIATISDDFMEKHFEGFDPKKESAHGFINFRGLIVTVRYSPSGSTSKNANDLYDTLEISIPGVVDKIFEGATHNELDKQVQEWLKDESAGTLKKIYQAAVSLTPLDPIAGNPSSLMGDMIEQAFNLGGDLSGWSRDSYNLFAINPAYVNASVNSESVTEHGQEIERQSVQAVTVPLYYAHVFSGGRQTLMFDMPITQYHYDASTSYSASLGVGLANKINKYWDITPELYLGGAGSIDMGSLSLVYSGFVKSQVAYPYHHWFFSLDDMVGYMQTQGFKISQHDTDYGLKNWAFDNGIGVGYKWVSYLVDLGYSLTNVVGNKWFIGHYNRLTLDVAKTKRVAGLNYNQLSLDVNYLFAPHAYNMFSLGLKYQF